jgi:hypothetical protein
LFKYDSIVDNIDICFKWNDDITIILGTRYECEQSTNHIKSISDIDKHKNYWSEVIIQTSKEFNSDIIDCLKFLVS